MSRMRVLGAAMGALMVGVGGASAADIYAPPPAAEVIYNPAPAFSWTGGYVGGLVGYGWGNAKVKGGPSLDPDGWLGGIYGGYNFQTNNMVVLGVEGDFALNGAEDKANGVRIENNWNSTLRARAGIAFDRFMLYGTGGLAVGNINAKIANGGSNSGTHAGWTVGAGMEAAITPNVIGRLEYRYTDYGTNIYDTAPKTKVDFNSSQVMVGIGYKF
ncbi:MAG: porin family protein [Rhizobiales bacterium]|nr:porin family protein [Hyphomicrobiales bacterium]